MAYIKLSGNAPNTFIVMCKQCRSINFFVVSFSCHWHVPSWLHGARSDPFLAMSDLISYF